MVCYCPLSVLSVPESILNEGQLHLAAIFQLSSCCHGDWLFPGEPARKAKGSQVEGSTCCKRTGWGEGGVSEGEREEGPGPGPGPGLRDRRKNSAGLFCHAQLALDKSAILKTQSIFQWPPPHSLSTHILQEPWPGVLRSSDSSFLPLPLLPHARCLWLHLHPCANLRGMVWDLWMFSIQDRKTSFTKDLYTWALPNPYFFPRTYKFFTELCFFFFLIYIWL